MAANLLAGLSATPGCLGDVVAEDAIDVGTIWITEVWQSREAHAASLAFPAVRHAITKARRLIARLDRIAETMPRGGSGLTAA